MNERGLALNIIMDITSKKGYNNIVLKKTLGNQPGLKREQKAFVTECVNSTLRNLILIDYVINKVSKTNTRHMKPYVHNLLRISVAQMLYMDKIPKWSVCDEAVKLIEGTDLKELKGFVNGVLRNVIRSLPDILLGIDEIEDDDYGIYLEIKYSCPRFLVNRFIDYIGYKETEEMLKFLSGEDGVRPKVSICVNTLKTDSGALAERLKESGVKVWPGEFMENALKIKGASDLSKQETFKAGLFHVMDESAMLAVSLMDLKQGQRVMDVCAAPGGKSFLSAYLTGDGGEIISQDIHEHKIKLINDGAKRLGLKSVKAAPHDAAVFNEDYAEGFDAVIVDAPCTGFGLIGKKPDIKYGKTDKDVSEMQGLQRKILNISKKYVKPSGTLLYCTCTLTPEENEKNVNWFLKTYSDFEASPLEGRLPSGIKETGAGYVRILPHISRSDGFFIAKFKRIH